MGIIFGGLISFPDNANAECISYIQSQTIAAAYDGDIVPTVNTMQTCNGDDISYQIPIATTITFDGIEYNSVYATTNSVITFGNPDNTYWDYPTTPSISLYSMDWYAGINAATDGLSISYSNGGFQINLQVIPYGNWSAPASNINILVAITNTGGISVAYSYQGPEYSNLRTGVRLTDGSIVSLEAWGATYIEPGSSTPTLQPEPVSDPSPSPEPITQSDAAAATSLSNDINDINSLIIAAANAINSEAIEPTPEPSPSNTNIPGTVIVEPEVITPEDPRFPDESDLQNEPTETTPSPNPEITPLPIPSDEPSSKPEPQIKDISQDSSSEQSKDLSQILDIGSYIDNTTMGISEDEARKLLSLAKNDPDLAIAIKEFDSRAEENTNNVLPYTLADTISEVQAESFLGNPIGAIFNVNPAELLSNFSELGSDMTDDQRQKAQEVIVPVIIASQIISRRIIK